MAVPVKKKSRSAMKKRRTHQKLPQVGFVTCSNCQELILPHSVCPKCGYYRGESVLQME